MEPLKVIEARELLKVAGFSQADFSRFIRMSTSFVSSLLSPYNTDLPLRYVRALQEMCGQELFELALVKAREKIREREERHERKRIAEAEQRAAEAKKREAHKLKQLEKFKSDVEEKQDS